MRLIDASKLNGNIRLVNRTSLLCTEVQMREINAASILRSQTQHYLRMSR